jgi:nucleoside-diphosphate-sugar epimerase
MKENVVRLAGLYHATRGPHVYWLQMAKEGRQIQSNEDGLVNLVHYEDAALAVLAALTSDARSSVFIASDGHPIRKDEIVSATLTSPLFKDSVVPQVSTSLTPSRHCYDTTDSLFCWYGMVL